MSRLVVLKKPNVPQKRAVAGTLFDPAFVYMKGADVQRTWSRYGWIPPSEIRNDYEFKKNREGVNT